MLKSILYSILLFTITMCISLSFVKGQNLQNSELGNRPHVLEVNERLLHPDDGLIIGNGDLSVSVYESEDRIIFRFGKSDVWDRRLDLSNDPRPLTVDEFAYGIKVEGWKCGPYGGPVQAIHGTKNPERMREVCQGSPPSYEDRPYPCPKPVGELVMQLPPDHMNLKINHRLIIEEGRLEIFCSWSSGVKLRVNCFIPRSPNVLVVNWKVENWNDETRTGNKPPVWFWLYRWADPTLREFGTHYNADFMHDMIINYWDPKVTPLSPPAVRQVEGSFVIEQTFPKDPLFKDGFCYWMTPFISNANIKPVDMVPTNEARIRILPDKNISDGWLAVGIPTSSDAGGVLPEFLRLKKNLVENPVSTMMKWQEETVNSARNFWSNSSVSIDDALLENLWYETLHIRRATNRSNVNPPGLFLPSTVNDYSLWHGDYHLNYNVQCPFLGDYASNHIDIGDAYFKAMEYLLQTGRKIARDYYHCRGAFLQLVGYPIFAEDDYLGIAPMGRMAYMTGWAIEQYWMRYRYTQDKNWLREKGYPVIRDCALFYTDFLKKGADGLYHAFPSNQGEDGFSGYPDELTDRAEVMQHMRYCLRVAVMASEELGVDEDVRAEFIDRREHAAPDAQIKGSPRFNSHYGNAAPVLEGIEKEIADQNPPEYGIGQPYGPPLGNSNEPSPLKNTEWARWYFGFSPYVYMGMLRENTFIADRDFQELRKIILRWRRPNGIMQGMAIANYGHAGAWTESLGVLGPFQEMMLQSWDGALRIFPAWHSNLSAGFRDLRAEGAFLVSSKKQGKDVKYVLVKSLAGSPLHIYNPFFTQENVRIRDLTTGKTITEAKLFNYEIVKISTEKNHTYVMEQVNKPFEKFE